MNQQNPQTAMSEFEDIQRLIRLKRFEKPEEDFTENFLLEFHQRQRSEMLKQSAVELLLERAATWWGNLLVPKWGIATAVAAVTVMGVWVGTNGVNTAVVTTPSSVIAPVEEKPFIPKMDLSDLPMANIAERNDAKLEDTLLRRHLEMRPALESNVSALPVGGGWRLPGEHNAVPAIHEGVEGGLGR